MIIFMEKMYLKETTHSQVSETAFGFTCCSWRTGRWCVCLLDLVNVVKKLLRKSSFSFWEVKVQKVQLSCSSWLIRLISRGRADHRQREAGC